MPKDWSPQSVVGYLLERRGLGSSELQQAFLEPDYERDVHDPFLLASMDVAVERLGKALKNNERIAIYGDYDIDGLSATTLLLDAFTQAGFRDPVAYIPDRFSEGYGLSTRGLQTLMDQGVSLVVTVDTGTVAFGELAWAKEKGLDVIVTDHHVTGDKLPPAIAIINPKRTDQDYPFNDLAGVGVAFKLAQGVQKRLGVIELGQEKWLLDLVAMGSVCDVVDLLGENRTLVKYGLMVLNKTRRPGLRALVDVAGAQMGSLTTYHLGFVMGPRLNAAGRIEHAQLALDLFTATDAMQAGVTATKLEELNKQRRALQQRIIEEALEASKKDDDPVLVLSSPEWSHGVVGIAAAKIMETSGKPTIILQEEGEESKGSMRSYGDFHAAHALKASKEVLMRHGGHAAAAGCTLKTKDIPELRRLINDHYKSQKLSGQEEYLKLDADLRLPGLHVLDWRLLEGLEKLEPFGQGNPRPVFSIEGVELSQAKTVGAEGKHLKCRVCDSEGMQFDSIGFGLGEMLPKLGGVQQAWFEFGKNEFMGRKSLQLVLRRVQAA